MNAEGPLVAAGVAALLIPGWADLPWLVHGFSTRTGGGTTVYQAAGELNLGFTVEDSRETVAENRARFLAHLLGSDQAGIVSLRQTHSAVIHCVDQSHVRDCASPAALEGDGLITDVPGVLLGILTADCVPVLVVDARRRAVGAFHAGWRGTVQQIVELGVERMREEFGSAPEDLRAAIGPAIGGCCYTVGEEVRQQFAARFAYADALFSRSPAKEIRLDLAEANRRQLLDSGLPEAAITMTGLCTSCDTRRFFSHRAERGVTGRLMSVIGVRR
jgi:YfiH family protein